MFPMKAITLPVSMSARIRAVMAFAAGPFCTSLPPPPRPALRNETEFKMEER